MDKHRVHQTTSGLWIADDIHMIGFTPDAVELIELDLNPNEEDE